MRLISLIIFLAHDSMIFLIRFLRFPITKQPVEPVISFLRLALGGAQRAVEELSNHLARARDFRVVFD